MRSGRVKSRGLGGWVWGCSLNCFFFISIACLMSLCVPMETKQNIPRPLPRPISPLPPPPPPTSSPSSTRYQRIFTVLSRQRQRLPVLLLCAAVSRAAPLRSTRRSRPNGFSFFLFFRTVAVSHALKGRQARSCRKYLAARCKVAQAFHGNSLGVP